MKHKAKGFRKLGSLMVNQLSKMYKCNTYLALYNSDQRETWEPNQDPKSHRADITIIMKGCIKKSNENQRERDGCSPHSVFMSPRVYFQMFPMWRVLI